MGAAQGLESRVIGLKHGRLRVIDQLAVVVVVWVEQLLACMLLIVEQ